MASQHIDRFDIVATKILKGLHDKFPAAFNPTPNAIGLTEEEPRTQEAQRVVSDEYALMEFEIRRALSFLIAEGLVSDRDNHYGPNFVLTAKGLRTLAQVDSDYPAPVLVTV